MKEKLMNIQAELKAPKSRFNTFGKYKHRKCEDIVEALKPLLLKYKVVLSLTDEIKNIGDRFYVEATALLTDVETVGTPIYTKAYAREATSKKGMDESQITGAASSYARKYALSGLLGIDDTNDADVQNNNVKEDDTPNNNYAVKIKSLVSSVGATTEQEKAWLDQAGIKTWDQCTEYKAQKVIKFLQDKLTQEEV